MYIFRGAKMIWLVMKNFFTVISTCHVSLSYCYIYCRMNFHILEAIVLFAIPYMGRALTPFCYPGDPCFPKTTTINAFAASLPNGFVVFPADTQTYPTVTRMRNLVRTSYPFAVVMAKSREDVKDTVAFASKYNLHLTVYGTGHDFNGRSTGNNTFQVTHFNLNEFNLFSNSDYYLFDMGFFLELNVFIFCSWT